MFSVDPLAASDRAAPVNGVVAPRLPKNVFSSRRTVTRCLLGFSVVIVPASHSSYR